MLYHLSFFIYLLDTATVTDPAPPGRVRSRARPRGDHLRERARARVQHDPGRGPRLRDRAGAPWSGPHPPLHALDRVGRDGTISDDLPRAEPHCVRAQADREGLAPPADC